MKHNLRSKNGRFRPVRSFAQLEQTALRLIRNALSQPNVTDDDAIAFAVAAMGADHAGLVARVFAREFKTYDPI
jgi:hypothetical protein